MWIRNIFLIGVLHVVLSVTSFAQGLGSPFITNISASTYNFASQNWDMVKDERGIIYFGNNAGILEYDGVNWRRIEVENNMGVRSLAMDENGTIYVGGTGGFGYLSPDSLGLMKYHSISSMYDTSVIKTPPNVWRTRLLNGEVYFSSFHALYRYSPYKKGTENKNKKIKVWYPKKKFLLSYVVNDKFYIQSAKVGLLEMQSDTFKLILDPDQLRRRVIFEMIGGLSKQNPNEILIALSDGMIKYNPDNDGEVLCNFTSKVDNLIKENSLYDIEVLPYQQLALSVLGKGVVIINYSGEIVDVINVQNGLQDETIWKMVYHDDILTLCTNNGISFVEIHSPFRLWDENNGINGSIEAINVLNEKFYIGGSGGIFYTDVYRDSSSYEIPIFKKVGDSISTTEVWCIEKYKKPFEKDTILLCGQAANLLEISKNHEVKIILPSTVYCISESKKYKNVIYAGGYNSLYVLKLNLDSKDWERKRIKGFDGQIRSICEYDEKLWITTFYNGVFTINLKADESLFYYTKDNYKVAHYQQKGLKSVKNNMVYCINDKLLFATRGGIYTYHPELDSFLSTNQFGKKFGDVGKVAYFIDINESGTICLSGKTMLYPQNDSTYLLDDTYSERLKEIQGGKSYSTSKNIWFFGGADGLVKINNPRKYKFDKAFNTFIRKVTIDRDSVLFYGAHAKMNMLSGVSYAELAKTDGYIPRISYDFNNISFDFSASFIIQSQMNEYSFFLEGFDKKWSAWQQEYHKEYTNLGEGSYIFRVKSKNIYGTIGNEAIYQFVILPPWYRSWWAYVIYVLLIVCSIMVIVKLNSKRLKRINASLEKTVKERTAELFIKNEELVLQNEKISAQTEKLQIANSTKNKFFSIIAHDLKNPFNIILGYLEELNNYYNSYSEQERKQMLLLMEMSSKNTYDLLENLLTWAQTQQNTIIIEPNKYHLSLLINEIIDTYSQNALNKKISVYNRVEENTLVYIDKPSMSFVIGNLINNAIKFTSMGGEITVESKTREGMIVLSVEDNGVGMSAKTISRLFRIDENISTLGTNKEKGTGLGLILCKEFVLKNGGEIDVESEVNKGSVFIITMRNAEGK